MSIRRVIIAVQCWLPYSLVPTEDTFGDDSSEPLKELFEHIYKEWEKLIILQNVDAIVNKLTEDCIRIYRKNGKTQVLTGRDRKLSFMKYNYDNNWDL